MMVLAGCVGTAPGTGSGSLFAGPSKPAGSSGGMDLDAAIGEAAAQMGKNLPAGTKVALVSVASSSAQFSEYVTIRAGELVEGLAGTALRNVQNLQDPVDSIGDKTFVSSVVLGFMIPAARG